MANTYRHWLDLPQEQLLDIIRRLSITELINVCSTSSDLEQRVCLEENFLRELAKRYLTDRTLGKDELKYIIIDIDHLQKINESKRLIFAAERNYEKVVMQIVDKDTTDEFSYVISLRDPDPEDFEFYQDRRVPEKQASMYVKDDELANDVLPKYLESDLSYTSDTPIASVVGYYSHIGSATVIAAAYNYAEMFKQLILKITQTKNEYYESNVVDASVRTASYNGSIDTLDAMKPLIEKYGLQWFRDAVIDPALIANNKDSLEWFVTNNQTNPEDKGWLKSVGKKAAKYLNSVFLYDWFYKRFPYKDASIYYFVAQNKTGAGVEIAKYLAETIKLGEVVPVDARAATIKYLTDKGLLHYVVK